MSKRFPPERFVLPAEVEPSTSVCYQVMVPNDPMHIAAFKGAIYRLAWQQSWARDEDHKAREVARVWMDIFNNLEECTDMPIQFRTVVSCVLEYSTDGGTSWDVAFDASACANEVIIERIEDGTLSAGGQQPGLPVPVPGQCYTYYVKLPANSRWMSPIRVSEDDTIQVTDVTGHWYDGAAYPVGPWNCADGLIFALGACGGSGSTQGTDPAPGVDHMRLIGNIAGEPDEYFDMYNGSYTVTVADQTDFFLLANDSVLEDNQGDITFKVEICKDAAGDWPVFYDFATGQHGWTIDGGSVGPGWGECGIWAERFESEQSCGGHTDAIGIRIDWGYGVHLTQVKVHYYVPNNINSGIRQVNRLDGTFIGVLSQVGGEYTTTFNFTETLNGLIILLSNNGADVGRTLIFDVEINGTGIAPTP